MDSVLADPTCNISLDKKVLITKILCGQNSRDKAYRMFGTDCVKRSVTLRLEDSAVQVYLYRICGAGSFSDQLQEATIATMVFMETLSICTSERINLKSIMEDRIRYVKSRSSSLKCSHSTRSKLRSRRQLFQSMIDQAADPKTEQLIFNRLGIRWDGKGNIVER